MRLAWGFFWACVAFAIFGCGGSSHGPRVARPPAPPPPESPAHRVACLSYAYSATPDDFAGMEAAGIGAVLDYDQVNLCARSKAYSGGLIFPLYYGRGGSDAQIEQITRDQVRNVAACLERVVAVYVWDEPELAGIPADVVERAIASAARAFPTRPRLITYGEKSPLTEYTGLTLRGAELYSKVWRDMSYTRKRLTPGVVPVPRAFDNGGKCCGGTWSDQAMADFIATLAPTVERSPSAFLLFYTYAEPPRVQKYPAIGWRDLPLTRAAITRACRQGI